MSHVVGHVRSKVLIYHTRLTIAVHSMPEKSCGAVIFRRNGCMKYLLLHYEGGHWDLVKGHVEQNESEKQTVLRETEEETGIVDLTFIEGYRESISYFYRRAGNTVKKDVIFYLVETKTQEVRLSREHVGFDWFTYERAIERLTYKNARDTLQKAHELLSKPRTQATLGEKGS